MRSLSSGMTTSSATVVREKCSRNKRKFRQDPPFPSQGSSNENNSGGNNSILSEGEAWTPEPRSVEALTSKSCMVDSSIRKLSDGGTNSPTSEPSRSLHQGEVKLMRFRSEQATVVEADGAGWERKREESVDGHSKASEEEDDFYELEEADWDVCTESELEDLLVKNLGSLYNEAINKIVAFGHSAEEALRAVLKHGRCYGGKDAVSNILENSLAYLTGKMSYATDGSNHSFSDLKDLHKHSLTEMVGLLREVRPLLSKGDAMWCLLMCDMNVPLACIMDNSALPLTNKEPFPAPPTNHPERSRVGSSSSLALPPLYDSTLSGYSTHISTSNLSVRPLSDPAGSTPLPPVPISPSLAMKSSSPLPSVSAPDVSLLTLLDSKMHSVSREPSDDTSSNFEEVASQEGSPKVTNLAVVDDCSSSEADDLDDEDEEEEEGERVTNYDVIPSVASLKLGKRVGQKGGSTTEPVKIGNVHSSTICVPPRGITEPSKVTDDPTEIRKGEGLEFSKSKQWTSEPLLREEGDSCELHLTTDGIVSNTEKLWDSVSALADCETNGTSQDDVMCIRPEAIGLITKPLEARSSPVKVGTVDERDVTAATERVPSSFPPSASEHTSSVEGTVITCETSQAFLQTAQKTGGGCLITETSALGKGQVEDDKDEMIMELVHRSKELEIQLQERSEWAKEKVMQAARRLSNDLQELKALRLEREETLRLKKDKQSLEDSMMKKLADLENSLRKAKSQLDEANKTVKKLETENAEVRAEMQAAKLSAAETQSSCQEMVKRERKSMKRAQAWERQKAKLQEELSEEKRKIIAHQKQIVIAKERQQQAEVRWRQEEKAKEDALLRADHERRAREQAETASKKREESLRRKAESNYQRHREDIQRLESEIAHFRTSAETAQLATSRWGPGVANSPHILELSSMQALKESNNCLAREIAELQDMARRNVHRERECVMCMCEEMSVVFLPCAHQVVCVKCNDLHEKQGMRDCPSCRTPIKQRIRVYGVST